jgi:hypothetical protein
MVVDGAEDSSFVYQQTGMTTGQLDWTDLLARSSLRPYD